MVRLPSVRFRGREMAAALLILAVVSWMGAVVGVAALVVVLALLLIPSRETSAPRQLRRTVNFTVSGSRVRVVEFAGYVYFDGAKRLLAEVMHALTTAPRELEFLIMDFRGAIGAERSAAATLARLQRLLGARGVAVVYTGMGSTLQRLLQRAGCEFTMPGGHAAEDLRRGLEWCDTQGRTYAGDMRLLERFGAATGDRWLLPQLLGRCVAYDLPAEAVVLCGEPSGAIFFVERGRLSVWRDFGDGDRLRLRTLGPGALVQSAVVDRGAELARVVVECDTPARVHCLSEAVREELAAEDPLLAAALERMVTSLATGRHGARFGDEKKPPRGPRGLISALSSSRALGRGSATFVRTGPG